MKILNMNENSIINKPPIIKKAILNPTEKRRISISLNLFIFKNLRRIYPGIVV